MAFSCILNETYVTGQFFVAENSFSVLIPVGYDDEPTCDRYYNLFVSFDPLIGTDDFEFSFGLIEYDDENDTEYVFWSGYDVAQFVSRRDRDLIRNALIAATKRLIDANRPTRVVLCSRDANAPQKAHQKFIRITHLFHQSGYVVTEADPYHGQRIWWMERKPEAID